MDVDAKLYTNHHDSSSIEDHIYINGAENDTINMRYIDIKNLFYNLKRKAQITKFHSEIHYNMKKLI